ncbi:unnamed protein product [Cunninghamella blakesleeana]
MYDVNLKYIAISYRWGEVVEQLVQTPDYTAHVTSFNLNDLISLYFFFYIQNDPDIKNIPYLWVDAISRNDTFDIYKNNNIIHKDIFHSFIGKSNNDNKNTISNFIPNTANQPYSIVQVLTSRIIIKENEKLKEMNELKMQMKKDELRKAYEFLVYLIDDWSHHPWVISEYNTK